MKKVKEICVKVDTRKEVDTLLKFVGINGDLFLFSSNIKQFPNYIFLCIKDSRVVDYSYLSDRPSDINLTHLKSIMDEDCVYEKIFTMDNLYIIRNFIKCGCFMPSYEPKKIIK